MECITQDLSLTAIVTTARIRKNTDGIEELAADIKERGLINPITVMECGNGRYQLIAGLRRLEASKNLGCTVIRATVLSPMAADDLLSMEYAENVQRRDFTVAERLEYADKIKVVEKAKARERQAIFAGGRDPKKPIISRENVLLVERPEVPKENSRDSIAKKAGFSGSKQYERAEAVAAKRPDLLEKIDAGEATIYGAYLQATSPPKSDMECTSPGPDKIPVSEHLKSTDQIVRARHDRLMRNPIYARLYAEVQEVRQDANRARAELDRKTVFFANQVKHFESNLDALKRQRDELAAENAVLRAQLSKDAENESHEY